MVSNTHETSGIAATWEAFKAALPDTGRIGTVAADLFADDAAYVCVPTGAGASGNADIVTFLRKVASQSSVVESEQIIGRAVGPSTVVEEAILIFTHESVLDWILPEVKATRKRVVVPLITAANFNEYGKIASIRKYWDQGSVLRQLGILPTTMFCKANSSETTLPILGPRIVDKLQNAVNNVVAIELPEEPVSRPSTAPAAERNDSPRRRHQPVTGILPQGSDDVPVRPNTSRQHKNSSSILASDGPLGSDDPGASPGRVRPSTRVAQVPGGRSNNIFEIGSDPLPLKTSVPIDPRRFQTQIALYDDSSAPAEPVSKPGNRRDPNWNAEDAAATGAASEKVRDAKPPGMAKAPSANASQWSIGHGESNLAPVHTGKRMGPVYANESHWSLGVQSVAPAPPAATAPAVPVASEPANVEDVEEEPVAEPEQEEEEERVEEVVAPQQENPEEEEAVEYASVEESVIPGVKSPATPVKSGLLFGADEPIARPNRRDPNARSEFMQSRPSARVMAPPGGNSTISLG
ncbi:hypothetical protein BJ742DRAFT_540081 [Cladochytrium replicatum]|nr:hypothetical protein BJ742DRAFT_540081 [Cladochytrium replicatum]